MMNNLKQDKMVAKIYHGTKELMLFAESLVKNEEPYKELFLKKTSLVTSLNGSICSQKLDKLKYLYLICAMLECKVLYWCGCQAYQLDSLD
jgi:hypothetical protein